MPIVAGMIIHPSTQNRISTNDLNLKHPTDARISARSRKMMFLTVFFRIKILSSPAIEFSSFPNFYIIHIGFSYKNVNEIKIRFFLRFFFLKRIYIQKQKRREDVKTTSKIMKKKDEVKNTVPIWEKLLLTVEEASAYSNIGRDKLYELLSLPECNFVVMKGTHKLIHRKKFEDYISKISAL